MARTYKAVVCLECGGIAMPWAPVWPGVCTDGGRHGPTQDITLYGSEDVDPLVEAAARTLTAISFLSLRDQLGHPASSMKEGWEALRVEAEALDALLKPFETTEGGNE